MMASRDGEPKSVDYTFAFGWLEGSAKSALSALQRGDDEAAEEWLEHGLKAREKGIEEADRAHDEEVTA